MSAASSGEMPSVEDEETTLELTSSELAWISTAFDIVDLPLELDVEPPADVPTDLLDYGWVVRGENGAAQLDEKIEPALRAWQAASLQARAAVTSSELHLEVMAAIDGLRSTVYWSPLADVHRFVVASTDRVLTHLLLTLELTETDEPSGRESYELSEEELAQLLEQIAAGSPITRGPSELHSASGLRIGEFSVLAVDDDQGVGGAVGWVDAGGGGLWIVEPVQSDDEESDDPAPDGDDGIETRMRLVPVDDMDLTAVIFGYLPAAFHPGADPDLCQPEPEESGAPEDS